MRYRNWSAGFWFLDQHQPQAALEHFTILLVLDPQKSNLHNTRGVALAMLARWREAIAEFETAIRLDPGNASAHCNLGVVYLEEKNPVAAIGALQECLRLSPNELRARVALARALQALKAQGIPAGR